MGVQKRLFHGCMSIILVLSMLTVPVVAAVEAPRITSATIGKQDLMKASEVKIIKEDLTRDHKILIVGQTEGGGPPVEKVEVSLNGGQTWKEATGRERWQYEFSPLPNYTYHLTLRVTNADGIVSSPERFGIKELTYLPITLSELIQERVDALARAYMAKDRESYMGFVSREYQNYPRGWHNLRKAIENDFKSLNNIVLRFSVNQVFELEEAILADIHWRLTYAGLLEPKEGYVEIHFDPTDQLAIMVQKKDLYFGSAPTGHDGSIVVQRGGGGFGFPGNHFVFIVTDLDKVGAKWITIRVRITGSSPFNGNITLTETPARSGRFTGSRDGCIVIGDRAEAMYIDEITSDWRRNVRRTDTLTL